jgi:hypothetical protein
MGDTLAFVAFAGLTWASAIVRVIERRQASRGGAGGAAVEPLADCAFLSATVIKSAETVEITPKR